MNAIKNAVPRPVWPHSRHSVASDYGYHIGQCRHGGCPSASHKALFSHNLLYDMSFNFISTHTRGLLLGAHTDAMNKPHNQI